MHTAAILVSKRGDVMYKILVVDDEPRVAAGIRNFLLGSDLDIGLVETASNGFEAVDYLRTDSFDLVLTDIQMSRMNGLELMEIIYMEQPHVPVIVISAHEKFDFAKQSLRLGAKDYLVKPVERDELLRIVGSVLREKRDRGMQSIEDTKLLLMSPPAGAETSHEQRRQELLIELAMERSLTREDIDALVSEWRGQNPDCLFGIVALRLDLQRGGFSEREVTLPDRKLLKYAALNILEECLAEWRGIPLAGYGNEMVVILQFPQKRDHPAQQLFLIGQMIHMHLKQYLNVESSVGISRLHDDVMMLPRLVEEANAAVEWRKLYPENKVFSYEDVANRDNWNAAEWIVLVDEFIRQLRACVTGGDQPIDTQRLFQELERDAPGEEQFNSRFGMLVYRIYGVLLENGYGAGAKLYRFDPERYFPDEPRERKLGRLKDYIRECASTLQSVVKAREESIVARIAAYIQRHYRNPALKIQDIAKEVHFSPAYISFLFKREMKKNIWDYVTELRVEEAGHLLASTDKKRYEIAYEVGYESPEHFSRMFKRHTGLSPAEYRKEHQEASRDET